MDKTTLFEEEGTLDSYLPPSLDEFAKKSDDFINKSSEFAQKSNEIAQAYHKSVKRLGQLETDIYDLKIKLQTFNEQKDKDSRLYEGIKSENETLRGSLSLLRSDEDKLREQVSKLKTEKQRLETENSRYDIVKNENINLRDSLDTLKIEDGKLQGKISELEIECENFQKSLEEKNNQSENLNKIEQDLKRHRRYRRRVLQYVKPLVKSLLYKNNSLERRMAEFNENLEQYINKKSKTIDYCKEKNQLAISELEKHRKQIHEFKRRKSTDDANIIKLQEERGQLRIKNSHLLSQVSLLQGRLKDKQNDLESTVRSQKTNIKIQEEQQKKSSEVKRQLSEQKDKALIRLHKMTCEFQNLKELHRDQSLKQKKMEESYSSLEKLSQQVITENKDLKVQLDHELKRNLSQKTDLFTQLDQREHAFIENTEKKGNSFKNKLHERLRHLTSDMEEIRNDLK